MNIRHVKNMKAVKTLTLVSLINKVSEFFLRSNKQGGGGIKKKCLIRVKVKIQLAKMERLILMHLKFSLILKSSKQNF